MPPRPASLFKHLAAAAFATGILAFPAMAQAPAGQPEAPRREQARSLAFSLKFAEALAIYDSLTASSPEDPALYIEARRAAKAGGDMRRFAIYSERQIKTDPGNYPTRQQIAWAYSLAGEEAEAERARADFIAWWKASASPEIRAQPFLTIDTFKAGPLTVNVIECLDEGGAHGIRYMFDVWGPKAPPLMPEEVPQNHRARFVLAREPLPAHPGEQGPSTPLSLGLMGGTGRAAIWNFSSEPSYRSVRDIVKTYIGKGQTLAASPPMLAQWLALSCVPERK